MAIVKAEPRLLRGRMGEIREALGKALSYDTVKRVIKKSCVWKRVKLTS